jgi:hypothetical protein
VITFALHVPSVIFGMVLMIGIEFAAAAVIAFMASRKTQRKP